MRTIFENIKEQYVPLKIIIHIITSFILYEMLDFSFLPGCILRLQDCHANSTNKNLSLINTEVISNQHHSG